MNNPLKSIVLEGTVQQPELVHRLCSDYFQLQSGIWEIAINSVSLSHFVSEDYIFTISTNLVQGDRIVQGHLKRFNVSLYQFKLSKDIQKEVIRTLPLWFIINNISSEYFYIFIQEWPKPVNPKRPKDIHLAVNVLFRRLL
jgi:hypothetical protein